MTTNTIWVKTNEAINIYFETLTCKKCQQPFKRPQQFLNCGHFACKECIGRETDCVYCKIPGEVTDIYSDTTINDLLVNLNIIADFIGFSSDKFHSVISEVTPVITNKKETDKHKKEQICKNSKCKLINETLNTSVCESVTSRITDRSKVFNNIPKNINKKNKKGETSLHIACRSNNLDRVKLLLNAGANPNTKDNADWTPLQEAANYGFYDICQHLLESGALPDMCGYDSRTALHEAVMNDDCELVKLLFNFNANTKVHDCVGKTPRDYCKSSKMIEIFKNSQNITESQSEILPELNKSIDLNITLNNMSRESKMILFGSNLNLRNRKLLTKFGLAKKIKVVNKFSPSVTHVLIDTDAANSIKLSLDVLFTILYGKWLLNSDCLSLLIENESLTIEDLSLFEVNPPQLDDSFIRARENVEKQNPKLFNNCYFYFAVKSYDTIHYDEMKLKKEDLGKLVAAGGGVMLTREPRPDDIQGSLSPFHVAHDSNHSLNKCTHYVIYIPDESKSSGRIVYNMPFLKTLPLMWFIESILRFKLLDPVDLGLQPQY